MRVRPVARFDRGHVDEQFERGAGLADRLGGAIVARVEIVAAADHRPDRAVAVDRDQSALGAVGRIGVDRRHRGALHVGVDRRPDVERLDGLVDQRVELRQHPVGEIAGGVLPLGGADQLDVLRMGVGGLGRGDRAAAHHQVERDAGAAARGLGVGGRRIIGRRLDEPGDDRRLGDRKRRRAVPEEAPRGGVDAVGAAAEIDPVQIELEDLVLGEAPFEREAPGSPRGACGRRCARWSGRCCGRAAG